MNLDKLKKEVFEANIELVKKGLVIYTWGNVSAIDRKSGLVVIKPSGVDYDVMTALDMVVVDLDGNIIEGDLKPSSDTPTHLELYKNFLNIGAVVHTHSLWATVWAQSKKDIPCFGTTHADYFYGAIPCTRDMHILEIQEDYEINTGKVIVERFVCIDPNWMPAVLVAGHGPFTWGRDAMGAVHNSVVLEQVSKMAFQTLKNNPNIKPISQELLDKHFLRKHGENAYYGQK